MRSFAMLTALILSSAMWATAQESREPTPRPGQIDTAAPQQTREDTDAIFGRIKQLENKNKIVIAVDNAPDKTYSLADPDKVVRVAEGLAIGDRVKVLERETDESETVDIVRDTRNRNDEQHRGRSKEADKNKQ